MCFGFVPVFILSPIYHQAVKLHLDLVQEVTETSIKVLSEAGEGFKYKDVSCCLVLIRSILRSLAVQVFFKILMIIWAFPYSKTCMLSIKVHMLIVNSSIVADMC